VVSAWGLAAFMKTLASPWCRREFRIASLEFQGLYLTAAALTLPACPPCADLCRAALGRPEKRGILKQLRLPLGNGPYAADREVSLQCPVSVHVVPIQRQDCGKNRQRIWQIWTHSAATAKPINSLVVLAQHEIAYSRAFSGEPRTRCAVPTISGAPRAPPPPRSPRPCRRRRSGPACPRAAPRWRRRSRGNPRR
jgi:hypothetical protein